MVLGIQKSIYIFPLQTGYFSPQTSRVHLWTMVSSEFASLQGIWRDSETGGCLLPPSRL